VTPYLSIKNIKLQTRPAPINITDENSVGSTGRLDGVAPPFGAFVSAHGGRRAQSSVIGVVLIVALVVVGTTGVLVFGSDALRDV
jgi:flagellin-like protein